MEDVTRFAIQLFTSVDRGSSLTEIQHLCSELDTDSADVADLKSDMLGMLTVAQMHGKFANEPVPIPTGMPPAHPPGSIGSTPTAGDLTAMLVSMGESVNNENWSALIPQVDAYLVHRNHLTQSGDRDMVAYALSWRGLAYYNLGRYQEGIYAFDEAINIGREEGEDVQQWEQLRELCVDANVIHDGLLTIDPHDSEYGICGHCNKRPKTTGATALCVRGYLLMFTYAQSWAIGCPTCVRIHLLKETFWNALFGWWGIKAFIFNCFAIPGNLISIIFVRDNPEKLEKITLLIIENQNE